MVDFDGQVGGLHIEQRRRALAQRCPGRRSSSGPKGEVRLVRLAELAVADGAKLLETMVIQNPDIPSSGGGVGRARARRARQRQAAGVWWGDFRRLSRA